MPVTCVFDLLNLRTTVAFCASANKRWRLEALCFAVVVWPSVNTYFTRPERIYCTVRMDFGETCREYSSYEWASLKRFSGSEVKGQGHDQTN